MNRWKVGLLACVVVVCMSAMLVGCQSQSYTPEKKAQTVAASALGKDGTLRVGVNASSAPLAGQTSSSSRIVGIDVDIAAYLADELGLSVEIVDVGNDPVSALDEGKVDVVLGVDSSSEDASGFWMSDPYIETGVALFGSSNETSIPTVDSKPKVAAQSSSRSSWRVTNLFGDDSLVSENDLKSAFGALASGGARYVAADAIIGTYVAYSNGYSAKIIALLQDPSGYCAAITSKNTELQNALGTALNKMVDGGVVKVIESKWLGSPVDISNMTVVKAPTSDVATAGSASAASPAPAPAPEAASGEAAATEGEAA